MAKNVARDPKGFPDTCIPLPPGASDDELAQLCHEHTARLRAHIAEVDAETAEPSLTKTRYDGTVKAACRIYQEHPLSKFHKVGHGTRKTYLVSIKLLELTVGARLIRNVTVLDVQHWYDEWRKGAVSIDQDGNREIGPERVDRAHDAVSMFRTVIYFMAALRHADCKVLAFELKQIKFEKGGAREQELTYQHVSSFIQTAIAMGQKGVMPYERALNMAIATAAQFEMMVRQKDIIGGWEPTRADRRMPAGITAIHHDKETWTGFFTWEAIAGWRWRMKTSKSKYKAAADFDLTKYSLLMPLLDAVPAGPDRTGPIIKGEHGLPVRYRSFVKWFRQIAEVAGIPADVQNMDARAGGATEAEEAGAALDQIQNALTHSKSTTTVRYLRRRNKKIADVADLRHQFRATEKPGS